MKNLFVPLCVWVMISAGCGGGPNKEIAQPAWPGKGDVASLVIDQGDLAMGQATSDRFTKDLQFFGYHLLLEAGSTISAAITRIGTSRALDTTLFLFGPRQQDEGFGDTAAFFDDDAGWGRQSRIDAPIEQAGEYLLVVGTANGRGRGAFRLEVRCRAGTCEDRPVDRPDVPVSLSWLGVDWWTLIDLLESTPDCDDCFVSTDKYTYPLVQDKPVTFDRVLDALRQTSRAKDWTFVKMVDSEEVSAKVDDELALWGFWDALKEEAACCELVGDTYELGDAPELLEIGKLQWEGVPDPPWSHSKELTYLLHFDSGVVLKVSIGE